MRVDVSESGIWILDLGQLAGVLGDVVGVTSRNGNNRTLRIA